MIGQPRDAVPGPHLLTSLVVVLASRPTPSPSGLARSKTKVVANLGGFSPELVGTVTEKFQLVHQACKELRTIHRSDRFLIAPSTHCVQWIEKILGLTHFSKPLESFPGTPHGRAPPQIVFANHQEFSWKRRFCSRRGEQRKENGRLSRRR